MSEKRFTRWAFLAALVVFLALAAFTEPRQGQPDDFCAGPPTTSC